jgi:hypothetical protein
MNHTEAEGRLQEKKEKKGKKNFKRDERYK